MPRLRFITEDEQSPEATELIEKAHQSGAPDPRVVRIMTRSKAGRAWVRYWSSIFYDGILPAALKELCRIRISIAHQCGYCSTVRSKVAQAEGLSEEKIAALSAYETSPLFTEQERAALRFADKFKAHHDALDQDAVYDALKQHFSEEEIIELGLFCAETDGAGKFVRSLEVLTWSEACEINPALQAGTTAVAAE
jgi:AhpD family alkylhydroperoxidase